MSIYTYYLVTFPPVTYFLKFSLLGILKLALSKYYLALQFLSKQCLLWTLLQLQCCLCQSFYDVAHFLITCIKHLSISNITSNDIHHSKMKVLARKMLTYYLILLLGKNCIGI